MLTRNGIKWNTEETILALDLYFRVPFGQITSHNPKIIQLASLLGRTPSSVGLKMCNLAHFDPMLIKRNIKGMENGSKLDKQVFESYYGKYEQLAYDAERIREQYGCTDYVKENDNCYENFECEFTKEGISKEEVVKVRIGQSFFRDAVLSSYNNRCCITGIKNSKLLIASHIKPWAASTPSEKTRPDNGLCLNALHDRAFDQGLITLDENYHVIISDELKKTPMDEETKLWLMSYKNVQIELPEKYLPNKEFLQYHNDVIFLH